MITFGNYRVANYAVVFSQAAEDHGTKNSAVACPKDAHQHMTIVFAHEKDEQPDIVLGLTQDPKTSEWTIHKEITVQLNAQAYAEHMGRKLSEMFGQDINVQAGGLPPGLFGPKANEEDEDERPWPGQYL